MYLLVTAFAMKDLGPLSYFLVIVVTRHSGGLFLFQQTYALEIIEKVGMTSCKLVPTPVETKAKLGTDSCAPFTDPTHYQSLVGALQYLTFTRINSTYIVQQVYLHMYDLKESHMLPLKRILYYLQGTLEFGLHPYKTYITSLVSFIDPDWGGCLNTQRSTSGYCIFLGDNLLSWFSEWQPTLSRSSTEAEYRGVANVVSESCWLRNLLLEFHFPRLKSYLGLL
ncbi:uncharacterized protein LOC112500040 [Cynara cardunculus var. scolymus]|uniref:uncharacterized protein LOC112500040 n=1 Tax=Cynara cardunculus var. scolymus TaxID=59895 RepID=UPI000D62F439|nr:uncharacterized protein LOC112500040 [Cynara cardunculus var. scolymus]